MILPVEIKIIEMIFLSSFRIAEFFDAIREEHELIQMIIFLNGILLLRLIKEYKRGVITRAFFFC